MSLCTYVPPWSADGSLVLIRHLDRLDDPMIWGIMPLSYMFSPDSLRWGLGSYDLCFTNK
jgi:monolysocardiolipin acyltransferase